MEDGECQRRAVFGGFKYGISAQVFDNMESEYFISAVSTSFPSSYLESWYTNYLSAFYSLSSPLPWLGNE